MTQPAPVFVNAARDSMAKWKIPASVTLAQWALESAWGKRDLGAFNYFGMKALPGQPSVTIPTHEVIKGQRILIQAAFRKFASVEEAFDAHGKLLATAGVYAHARTFLPDPFKFGDALTGTYATDPHYGASLASIIRGSNLTQYDK